MSQIPVFRKSVSRRRLLQVGAVGAGAIGLGGLGAHPGRADAAGLAATDLSDDAVAQAYYRVLLKHTRWVEAQWDASLGHYPLTDSGYAVVLGNAVLLTRGTYDAAAAGVDAATLMSHTVATLRHFAASSRLAGGTEWGQTLFWDATFESYFQLAGRLLWASLDATTRANLDAIAIGQAQYATGLGTGNDPRSGGWTPNGLNGGWVGDTKMEEMGVYADAIAPGLAWAPAHADAAQWRTAFGRWIRNQSGLRPADRANPTVVDGVAISANTAQNLYDTFIVENHGSFAPHYQNAFWGTGSRNTAHFVVAGQPIPAVLTHQPNSDRLWQTILLFMSDAGEAFMPLVADREFLYGRDVSPLAFRAQVLGDRTAAWAEAALAQRLEAYQAYPPLYRMAKFSGEPKYEPEARAEIAIAYLLHEWRKATTGILAPATAAEVFAGGVRDFGSGPGIVAHQSPRAWAAAVSKAGFVKFAWQPDHDDWLFAISGSTPMFLPATSTAVQSRTVRTYAKVRDGFDASATVLGFAAGRAGFVTLPGGSVVYATTGLAAGEGTIKVRNLTMPGMPGLDGTRSYVTSSVTTAAAGTGRRDELTFPATSARWVRMLGVTPAPTYGYSVFEFEVRSGATGPNLALNKATTASSQDTGYEAVRATDGQAATRWAVGRGERTRADSWLAVDLGAATTIDRVTLTWEVAAGRAYRMQVSGDGITWRDVAAFDTVTGSWKAICVEGRAALVVRGTANPLIVAGDVVKLSDGPAAAMVVEGSPGTDVAGTRRLAELAPPTCATLRVSRAEDHLTLFNLTGASVSAAVSVPQDRTAITLYEGVQTVTAAGTSFAAAVGASGAVVLAPRFVISLTAGGAVPVGLQAEVLDAGRVRLSGVTAAVRLTCKQTGVSVNATSPQVVTVAGAVPYPLADLALGATALPADPLPPGMSAPAAAVDGRADTAWTPGTAGRMVVDLGSSRACGAVRLDWVDGASPRAVVGVSADGLTYQTVATIPAGGVQATLAVTARYVAVSVPDWRSPGPRLRGLAIDPS